jgi:hypothetical protein
MLGRLRHTLDAVITRTRFEREMREELRLHIQHRADDVVARGMSRDDAVRQARLEFGAIEKYKEQCRDERGFAAVRPLHGIGADVRLAARRLLATPQFLIFAVVSLGVGIGVTTASYSLLQALVRKPIAVTDPALRRGIRRVLPAGAARRARRSEHRAATPLVELTGTLELWNFEL